MKGVIMKAIIHFLVSFFFILITFNVSFVYAQPTHLEVDHRNGQTFITWQEESSIEGEQYLIYKHNAHINAHTINDASLIYEVYEGSAYFYSSRYISKKTNEWEYRNIKTYVIEDHGQPLSENTGLLVWTPDMQEFNGNENGLAYYAVITSYNGIEDRDNFTSDNSLYEPVLESIEMPKPIEVDANVGEGGHLFIQFMDLKKWNPTFHAPNRLNKYYGLDPNDPKISNAIQYAYDYVVYEPLEDKCGQQDELMNLPVILYLHGHGGGKYGPVTSNPCKYWCTYTIVPLDIKETWFFGFAQQTDYRTIQEVNDNDSIVNYTEQRLLQMVHHLLDRPLSIEADDQRVYVYGHSMGGSGTLALSLRYPNVFAASYASEPMTNYYTCGEGDGTDWRLDVFRKWGGPQQNLPVIIDAPNDWAEHLTQYNGTGVWDWQNHQQNLIDRQHENIVPIGLAHGMRDNVINWETQGEPVYDIFNRSRHCWGGAITNDGHRWLGFRGLPPGMNIPYMPFHAFQMIINETVPGISELSENMPLPPKTTGYINNTIRWSSSWDRWHEPPVDQIDRWEMSFCSVSADSDNNECGTGMDQFMNITPRRLQQFQVLAGETYIYENRKNTNNALIDSGVIQADDFNLLTVKDVKITPQGNRLVIWKANGNYNLRPIINLSTSVLKGVAPLDVHFDASPSYDPDGHIVSFEWDFGDGRTAQGDSISTIYHESGTYETTLIVTDNHGDISRVKTTIKVLASKIARPLPDTTDGIYVFNDQLPGRMSDAQVRFAASHYVGTQKMTRSQANRLRDINPDFLILHYRLGNALGYRELVDSYEPNGEWVCIVEGDDWVREWPDESMVKEEWFFHEPVGSDHRIMHKSWGWYLADLDNVSWRNFWQNEANRQLQANDNDGLFLDSMSVPNYLGAYRFVPSLPQRDDAFEKDWSRRIHDYLTWLQTQDVGKYYIIPNVGHWITKRDCTDYLSADGLMIEGFSMWKQDNLFSLEDWKLQLNRVLKLVNENKIVIAQTYVQSKHNRLFALASFLLIKGNKSFINIDLSIEPEWWPEYDIALGSPVNLTSSTIEDLESHKHFFQREYSNGYVYVNYSDQPHTIDYEHSFYRPIPSGGGVISSNGETNASLSYDEIQSITIPPFSAEIILKLIDSSHINDEPINVEDDDVSNNDIDGSIDNENDTNTHMETNNHENINTPDPIQNEDGSFTIILKQGQNGYYGFSDTTISGRHSTAKPESDGNYGGNKGLGLYNDERRVLVKFDMSGIPEDADIVEASLMINVINGNSQSLNAYMLKESWEEGTCIDQYTCQIPDGVTWFLRDNKLSNWSKQGGVWHEDIVMSGNVFDNKVKIDMTDAVKSWSKGNRMNHGLILREVDQWTYLYLSSKESDLPPMVEITYFLKNEETDTQAHTSNDSLDNNNNNNANTEIHTLKLKQGHHSYTGFSDTTISSRRSTSRPENQGNYGGNHLLGLYNDERRVLMAFDVSDIPENAKIIDARLSIHVISGNSYDVKVFMMNESWEEGSCIDQYVCRQPDGATWLSRGPELGDWSIPGGLVNKNIQLNTSISDNKIEIDVTKAVQLWVNAQAENNGIMLKEVSQWTSMLLSSSESSQVPEVIIRYQNVEK